MCHTCKEPADADERKRMLQDAKDELRVMELMLTPIRNRIKHLKDTCPHQIVCQVCKTTNKECLTSPWPFGHLGAVCAVCGLGADFGRDLGWFCPDSPDHICYYHSVIPDYPYSGLPYRRAVILRTTEEFFLLPQSHDPHDESDDWCIFCKQPEERK
jgi:hypothetical protein